VDIGQSPLTYLLLYSLNTFTLLSVMHDIGLFCVELRFIEFTIVLKFEQKTNILCINLILLSKIALSKLP